MTHSAVLVSATASTNAAQASARFDVIQRAAIRDSYASAMRFSAALPSPR
jgi:hypothetical protein